MRKSVLVYLVVTAFIPGSLWAGPFDGAEYHNESTATVGDISSGIINPAGLSFFGSMGVRYTHNFADSTYRGDDSFLICSQTGFFALEWLRHTNGIFRRKYTFAMGERFASNFYGGISYSWFGGSSTLYKKRKVWKLGLLYHPRPFASLGFVVDNINEPRFDGRKERRLYRSGFAVRPIGEKLTISTDTRWIEGNDVNKIEGDFRLALGPFNGVSFGADYATEGFWKIGLIFNFDQSRIGAQGNINRSREYGGGSYFAELGALRYESMISYSDRVGLINLGSDIVEEPSGGLLFGSSKRSLYNVIAAIRKGAADPGISGLLVRIDGARFSFASAQELRNAIMEFRLNGKPVTVYLDNGGNIAYYLASAADKTYMNPTGFLELNGLSATAMFYTGAMEKLGVKAEVIRTGAHKTYGDGFTETGLTEEAREQINWILDDIYDQFVEGISTGRKLLSEDVKRLIDNGPYSARDAYTAGLIDGLKHFDELASSGETAQFPNLVKLEKIYKVESYDPRWSEPKSIAIVYAVGTIRPGNSGFDFLEGKYIGSRGLARELARIRYDNSIKAVVLRIDSPGGDLFGSDEIHRQLELLKGKKPLVVSMAGVAASGGYYIAGPGDDILASPGTITGSIGVVAGKSDLSGLYEKIGVRYETITRGRHADIRSPLRPASEEERKMAERQVWQYYDDFVSKVSTWRKIDYDSVNAIGQGRVWTGRQARERGLVDSYGGIWEAVDLARQKAEIDTEDRIAIRIFPRHRYSLFEPFQPNVIEIKIAEWLEAADDNALLLRMPYDLKIE